MESLKRPSRRTFLRWVALVGAGMLAGCSLFKPQAPQKSGQQAATGKTVPAPAGTARPKLLYAHPSGQEFQVLTALIQEFNQSGLAPNIEVQDLELKGDPFTALKVLAAGNVPADVHIMADEFVPQWVREGMLLSLDPFLVEDSSFDLTDFYEQLLANDRYSGQLWALPFTCGGTYLFINKDLFTAGQVDLPKPEWTWEDFRATALALANPDEGRWGCGMIQGWWQMAERIWQNGAEAFDDSRTRCLLDQPEALEAVDFWVDLTRNRQATPGPADTSRGGNWRLFRNGKVAMYEDYLYIVQSWKQAPFKWDIAYQPYQRRKVNALISGSQAISARTKQPKEAWALLKFLTSTEAMTAWATAIRLPCARKSANAKRPYVDPSIDINWDLVPAGMDNGRLPDITPQYEKVAPLLERMVAEFFTGEKTVKDVVAGYVPQIDALIEEGFAQG